MNSDPARRWAQPIDEARNLLRLAALSDYPDMLDRDDEDDIRDLMLLINRTTAALDECRRRLEPLVS